jgi:hypothetical protein
VVTGFVPAGGWDVAVPAVSALAELAEGVASRNAEGGSPPKVCASAAFNA